MSLKAFFQQHKPDELTEEKIVQEIRRLENTASNYEKFRYESDPHMEAVEIMRGDVEGLKKIQTQLLAGHSAISPYERGEVYQAGSVVQYCNALWQAKSSTGERPANGAHWLLIDGTPDQTQQIAPPVVDMSDELTKGIKVNSAADNRWFEMLVKAEQNYREIIKTEGLGEDVLRRAPSLRYFLIETAISQQILRKKLAERDEKIEALTRRIDALEEGGIKYYGVHQRAQSYSKGAVVTSKGDSWIALRSINETEEPGKCDGWQLMAKAGKDA